MCVSTMTIRKTSFFVILPSSSNQLLTVTDVDLNMRRHLFSTPLPCSMQHQVQYGAPVSEGVEERLATAQVVLTNRLDLHENLSAKASALSETLPTLRGAHCCLSLVRDCKIAFKNGGPRRQARWAILGDKSWRGALCGLFLRSRAQNTEADVQKDHPFLRSSKRPFLLLFVLFCFVLFCFVLFCFVLFCFVLFCFVLFANWVEEAPFQNLAKKHGVVSGRCFSFFACFETTIIFLWRSCYVLHRQFFLSRNSFPDHLPSAGLVGRKKNSLLGDV